MIVPGGSWNSAPAGTIKDPNSASHTFSINERPLVDQCLWVHVVNKHDEVTTPSNAKWVLNGTLATPEIDGEVYVDAITKRATVTIKNNSSVPDSTVSLYYINRNDKSKKEQYLTSYQHDETEKTGIAITGWNGTDPITFAVRAWAVAAGDVSTNMSSALNVLPGNVPLAPSGRGVGARQPVLNYHGQTIPMLGKARMSHKLMW